MIKQRIDLLILYFRQVPLIQFSIGIFGGLIINMPLVGILIFLVYLFLCKIIKVNFLGNYIGVFVGVGLISLRIFLGGKNVDYIPEIFLNKNVFVKGRVMSGIEYKNEGCEFVVEVENICEQKGHDELQGDQCSRKKLGQESLRDTQILVYGRRYPPVREGDVVWVTGKIKDVNNINYDSGTNDGDKGKNEEDRQGDEFSYGDYLKKKGIVGIIYWPKVELTGKNKISWFKGILVNFRLYLLQKAQKLLPEPHCSLLMGIIFGVEGEIEKNFAKALQDTGTTHIIVASGYNIGVLVNVVEKIFLFIKKKLRCIIELLVIWSYVFFLGGSIPILRAAISSSLSILAFWGGVQNNQAIALCISAVGLVLVQPQFFSEISFQLSVLSTFGLIFLLPSLENFFNWIPAFLRSSFLESVAAVMITSPIILQVFGRLSVISFLANLLVLPLLELIMLIGVVLMMWPVGGIGELFLSSLCFVFLEGFVQVVERLSAFEYAVLDVGNMSELVIIFIWCLIFLFILFWLPCETVNMRKNKIDFLTI